MQAGVDAIMTRILIIEDDADVRNNLAEALRLHHYQPLMAASGSKGIETAKRELPDLILCDVTMPDLDGHAVLNTLRNEAKTARIPFVFLTGKGARSDIRAGMDRGADDYLVKPVR